MGLFINNAQHLRLFKSTNKLLDNNQVEFQSNFYTELLKEQQASNEVVHRAVDAFKTTQNQSNLQQMEQIKAINSKLHELQKLNIQHKEVEKNVTIWLEKLEDRNLKLQTMMKDEQYKKNDLIEQVESMSQSQEKLDSRIHYFTSTIDEIVNKINQYTILNKEIQHRLQQIGETNEQMIEKIDGQYTLNEQIINQITNIDETQHEIINRADNQEGLLEKISRQMDNIRSIFYERTNFLDEKIKKLYEYFNRIHS